MYKSVFGLVLIVSAVLGHICNHEDAEDDGYYHLRGPDAHDGLVIGTSYAVLSSTVIDISSGRFSFWEAGECERRISRFPAAIGAADCVSDSDDRQNRKNL